MHIARRRSPAPATEETWVTSQHGDPVFMVAAEPSESLAGELRRLLPQLRQVVGEGRRVTVCFDRGGWSPALFADITGAGFDLLTWRKGPAPDLPAGQFTTITCADDRGREHQYDLADTTITLTINQAPRKRQTVSLRQAPAQVPAPGAPPEAARARRATPGAAGRPPPPAQPATTTTQMTTPRAAPAEAAGRDPQPAQAPAAPPPARTRLGEMAPDMPRLES